MAGPDEGLDFIIGVAVDDEGVQPALDQVQTGVARTVDAVNAELEKLGGVDVFRSIVQGADLASLSVRELAAGAEQATALLKIMQESQRAAASGTGVPISRLGGLTAADIETQRALIEEQRRLLSEPIAPSGTTGISRLGTDAEASSARVRELEANLARLRAEEEEYAVAEARLQRVRNAGMLSSVGSDPIREFRDGTAINYTAGQHSVAQDRADVAQTRLEEVVAKENANPTTVLSAQATAKAAAMAEQQKAEQLAEQGRLAEHQAALEEQLVGLSFARRQATLGVLQAKARVAEYDETGIRAASTRLGLQKQQEAAEQRLQLVKEKEAADAEKQARAAAVGGSGGGFFGNFGYGFTHGFGGGDRGGAMGEAGFQLGMVAQYTLYYQAFRDIEDAIKASISETVDFERHVTDLSVQLGTSRDNARDLANTLGDVAAANGLSPSQGVALGQQFAGTFAGQAPAADLAVQGATYGSQLAVVTGKNAQEQLADATAAVRAFNLNYDQTGRVLDAAATASQHFLGSANPANILPGLAQIGDLAAQAGFSVEQTANAIGDITSRTGESSDAAAGELRRFLGREGNVAFQQVFSREGINTTLPFQQELDQLSRKFDTLSQSERNFIVGQFGGGRAGAAALVFLEDFARIQDEANKSTEQGGTFQREYGARLNDLRGILSVIHGELSNLAKDFGETGVFGGIGELLKMVEPTVRAMDDLVRTFNELTTVGGHLTGIRDVVIALGELAAIVAVLRKFGVGESVGNVLAGVGQRIPGVRGLPGIAGRGAEVVGEEEAAATGVGGLRAAAVQAATAVRTAGQQLAAALDRVAAQVSGGGTEIAAAETEVAAEVAAGGAGIAGGEAAAGAEAAAGGAASAEKGFLGASVFPALGVALGGAVAIDAIAHAVSGQISAENKADNTNIKGSTADDLNASATALKEAAQASRASSGGLVGGFTNYASIYFGGEGTGAAANRADHLASLARFEAKALDKANTSVAQGGDISATISLDSQQGITNSIKNLQAQGLDAGQVLAALNERLNQFADAANGAANVLVRGQSALVAQQIANNVTNRLVTNSQTDVEGFAAGAGNISLGTANAAVKFAKLDPTAVNTALDKAANDYFHSQGLDQGGSVTKKQENDLIARETQALKDHLRKNGFSADDIKNYADDITLAVSSSVRSQVADMNALAGQHLTQDQIGQVLQDAPQLVQQAGQEAGNRAALSGDVSGGALVTAQSSLAQARELYATLARSSADAKSLQPLQDEIDQLTLATQQAVIQHLQVLGDLAASVISPNDKMGQIDAQVSTVSAELATATDADTRSQLQAKLNQLRFQQAEQAVADANAMASAQIASGDAVGKAVTDYQNAVRTYNELVTEGAQGQPLSQAFQAMNDARQAAIDARVAESNALALSNVDPRDTVGLASQAYQNTLNQLRNTPRLGADGKQTAQYSALAQSAAQEYVQWLQQVDQLSNARAVSGIDPRNTLALAGQKIRNDRQVLADDLVDSTKYYQDLNQLHEDELAMAQERTQRINAMREAGVRAGDPLAAAGVALRNARATLANDLVGTTQYFNDLAAVNQAEASLAQAIADRAKETAMLRGDTTDPVHQALVDLQAARVKLAQDQARHTGDLAQDQLAVESAEQAAQKAVFDQQLSNQQAAYSLHRESAGQYLSFLESQDASIRSQLSGMKKGAEGYQQLVDELNQVDQLILGLNEQVSGQFNLGDIKVPSIYEVRRSLAESNQQVIDASTTNNAVTINGVDMAAVVNYLNSILGVTATGSRATTATRKAA